MTDLSTEIAGIKMKNPVMNACGTFDITVPGVKELSRADKIGAYIHKSITLEPREGNPQPRICETESGIINSIGLQNVGIRKLIDEKLDIICTALPDTPVIISIAGDMMENYLELTAILVREVKDRIAGIEVNVSCPNVKEGMAFGCSPKSLFKLISEIKLRAADIPIIVKLTPNVTDIVEIAREAEKAGADAVSLINTLRGMAHMKDERWIIGGLSGRAIRPIALYMVWAVAKVVNLPIIGMGGISNARDALNFLLVGASAVAVGTENFPKPWAMADIVDEMEDYLEKKGYKDIAELKQKEGYK